MSDAAALELLAEARAGDRRALGRVLTLVENEAPGASAIVRATHASAGTARLIGVTGPPGTGKSTLVARLIGAYRATGARVAVVAVDPSSPFTGGAILGDRIRMQGRDDDGVFIRSMASRGNLGGLARASGRVVSVLDALGNDIVIVETVGVGQEEVAVVRLVDTVCVVTVPGLGDDIQAIKAGVLEIADVLVVNKSDRPGADEAARDLGMMLGLVPPRSGWRPPIISTCATTGDGIEELVAAIAAHGEWVRESGERERRRREAARTAVEDVLHDALARRLRERIGEGRLDDAVARVAARELDPYAAAEALLALVEE